jgi:NDP-sugar pyrophosphorylase family protein
MTEIELLPAERYGYDFIPPRYLPAGKDEYWLRNRQALAAGKELSAWRSLKPEEIETLVKNDNHCADWNALLVRDPFEPALIKNSAFYGLVRLGKLSGVMLRHHDFCIPAGIRNSTIISSDIGDNTAIQDCSYISHYLVGDRVILSRIDEMQTTNHAKFGNGVLKDGEEEDVRVRIDVMNEAGGRSILPFRDMIPADAFLWACYRDDAVLLRRLESITQECYGGPRGDYGVIGSGTVIKSCAIIKDLWVGECAYIKGAHKLKNLTILSSADEPSQIGEGVEMVNGIVGYGCHSFYGSKAVRFVMGRNSNLKYGARLIHSVLGDNSTVSCCEILNNLIFPVHEQHHNNSFLIASMIQGMSNMAAGATIGSNHNSRANDGEIRAGRGFWPALSVTLKHSSRFASFVLVAKGNYPHELDIRLPFSMVNNNQQKNRLEVMPAYYWLHNLYALERNSRKSRDRDRRKIKIQHIETDYLAPDTAEELIAAIAYLDDCLDRAGISPRDETRVSGAAGTVAVGVATAATGSGVSAAARAAAAPGAALQPGDVSQLPARGLERGKREEVLLKPLRGRAAYRRMLHYYVVQTLARWLAERPELDFPGFAQTLKGEIDSLGEEGPEPGSSPGRPLREWVNMGGQLVPAFRLDRLRRDIGEGKLASWEAIHRRYREWRDRYPLDRLCHAWGIYASLGTADEAPGLPRFIHDLETVIETKRWIAAQVYTSRAKDFHDSFRQITYRNMAEMEQVIGKLEENPFIVRIREETREFEETVRGLIARLGVVPAIPK